MNKEILRKIGLTEGEIRVYESVIKLGTASTGPIMEKCGISSSKIYLILDRLIQKGFVTYTIENNVKKFHPTNPVNIMEYIAEQEQALEKNKKEAQVLVKELQGLLGTHDEESAKIYHGTKSIVTAFQNILEELPKKEYFYFIGAPTVDLDALALFFQNLHAKREDRKISTLGIADISTKQKYLAMFKERKNIRLKFINLPFPHAIGIGVNRIIITLWEPAAIGFEIESKRMAKRYREFFMKLWNKH
ncbi:helix-turn-helix domain-containing protein [Candidatus Woesearchaeota archaeon]|nr:helix-turn-helix domain-containing protein [Candidatus Woesearchaeota archaeon]